MKQRFILILLGLLLISVFVVGCGGGSGGNDVKSGANWLVGTWEGTLPVRPEGWGVGDFEGYPISISVLADPLKTQINGFDVFSYTGSVVFNGNPYLFGNMSSSLIWGDFDPESVTLLISTEDGDVINLWWEAEAPQSVAPTTLKFNWQIDVGGKTDSNTGMEDLNYFITLTKK